MKTGIKNSTIHGFMEKLQRMAVQYGGQGGGGAERMKWGLAVCNELADIGRVMGDMWLTVLGHRKGAKTTNELAQSHAQAIHNVGKTFGLWPRQEQAENWRNACSVAETLGPCGDTMSGMDLLRTSIPIPKTTLEARQRALNVNHTKTSTIKPCTHSP